MTDNEIAKSVAERVFRPFNEDDPDFALQLFVERVALPQSVEEYGLPRLESYIRDALKRGTDHWEICSPADAQVSSFADNEDMQ
jgi:hypothetical protein